MPDTHDHEHDQRHVSGEEPEWRSWPGWVHAPFALVGLVALIGFARVAMLHWREGSVLIAGALLLASALRLVLSSERLGLLALRSRWVDVAVYAGLGLSILIIALTIKDGPFS